MSLTVSVLQFKQLLGELPPNHLGALLSAAGMISLSSLSLTRRTPALNRPAVTLVV
jgi:hypothetical protein